MSGEGWNFWLYLAACITIPAAWGVFSAWLFARIDRRRSASSKQERPMVDYTI
jgi:hypothetical protein